jgi:hypothetical protein
MMSNQRKRKSRYIRPSRQSLKQLVLQPRDLEIVKTVYEYRFLKTCHLTALITGDRTSIEKRLRRLWEHRYIERSFLPVTPGIQQSTGQAIYSLDYRGANLLAKELQIESRHLKHVLRHNKPQYVFLEHQLMITQFRCVLTLALRRTQSAEVVFWRQDKEIQDRIMITDSKGIDRLWPIVPDGYFCLQDSGGRMYWFLEADRYTMDHRRWLNKMKAYYHWWQAKAHTEKLGIKSFRVLAVCPSRRNRDARLEMTKKVRQVEIEGKITSVGSNLFWFVAKEDYSLGKAEDILECIFKMAKVEDDGRRRILE